MTDYIYYSWRTLYFEVLLNLTGVFLTLTEVFPCFFLSCKANARVKLAKTGHGPHSSTLVVICVVRLLFVLFRVLFVCKCVLPSGDNPTAVNKCIILKKLTQLLYESRTTSQQTVLQKRAKRWTLPVLSWKLCTITFITADTFKGMLLFSVGYLVVL